MIDLILAQDGGIEDWIQIIVVVAVIAFSVLGQISKTLIEKFSPKDSEREGSPKAPRRTIQPPDVAAPPRPPVAKPVPPRAQRPAAPQPARPVRPVAPRPAAPPVARTAKPSPRSPAPTVTHPPPTARPPVGQSSAPVAPPKPVPEDERSLQRRHLAHLVSTLEHEDEVIEAEVCEHISHVEGVLKPESKQTPPIQDVDVFERPSRTALRRAVVLSEMLAPPLALRERTERW